MSVVTVKAECFHCHEDVPIVNGRFIQHGDCPGWFADHTMGRAADKLLESRFTPASPLCPHPERYHSDDADSTEHEVTELVASYVRALRPEFVLETGTAWGQTAEAIGEVLHREDYEPVLYTLEPDGHRATSSQDRCVNLPVVVVRQPSLNWTPPDDVRFGFAWFDSLLNLRVPEFLYYRKYLAPGAFVGFHDTAPHQGNLRQDILKLEEEGLLLPTFLPTPRGVCFAEVT